VLFGIQERIENPRYANGMHIPVTHWIRVKPDSTRLNGKVRSDQAVQILESRDDIEAVFTDVNMPDFGDWLKVMRAICGNRRPIRLIVTSSIDV
jgi:CheY-like chemotaxis protein